MGQLEEAFRDAAGEVAQIKSRPSNRYWWLYGTIKAKNANGTLDVAIDGVTIQQVKATVSCMTANVGDRVIVLKAGPLMTCVDVIATSDKVVTHADSIEGTISSDNLPVGSTSQRGIMQVGNGLSVADGILSFDGTAYAKESGIWNVLHIGRFCLCSCVWNGETTTVKNAWGTLYDSDVTFTLPDYPVTYRDTPASVVDYVHSRGYTAFVERKPDATKKSAGTVWLCRPMSGQVIENPQFAIIAAGWV